MSEGKKIIARNRRASHDYELEERYEAGLVLSGSEIKSVRANKVSLQDGFVQEQDGELWLMGVHIAPYEQGGAFGHTEAVRPRKLLLHKREIARIITRLRERGNTMVPTQVYLIRGRAKVEVALARGKKLYDKRQAIAKREAKRDIERALKNN
ncbi:SsrA-binding protein SmpB [bacterium]|nr:SsrA-binding protein SmpB [bacterium]